MRNRSHARDWSSVSPNNCEHNEGWCAFYRRGDVKWREQNIMDLEMQLDLEEEIYRRRHGHNT